MKLFKMFLAIVTMSMLLLGCSEDNVTETEEDGTLDFRMTTWNAELSDRTSEQINKRTTHTLDLIDIRHYIPKIEVTTDEIAEGIAAEDIIWTTMYESSVEMLHTEREVSIQLPVGNYQGLKLTQRNRMAWVIEYQGNPIDAWITQIDGLNDDDLFINYFGADGLFDVEDGLFVSSVPGEQLGSFEIRAGETTNLVMRLNFTTVDWYDNDDSGDWSDGDAIDNHQLPDGITTMTDFIVTY
ncbi:MAG: hypothetical protein HOD64_07860 [Candidatus Cloacimonetes bacterium]|jgi:hypothetical protein|nr:hypothetical protein [Candidatus Cloacimonadota bacterium]